MDDDRFDALAKAFGSGASRRGLLKMFAGGALSAAAGALGFHQTEASTRKRSVGNLCRVNEDCASNICAAQAGSQRRLCACGSATDCPPAADQCHLATCSAGACSLPPVATGSPCGSAAHCLNGGAVGQDRCNGSGICIAGTATPCAPYICRAASCLTQCASETDCTSGNYCASGHCAAKKPVGSSCAAAGQCLSGHCVDGVCCDGACGGQCEACNLSGLGGTCSPATGAPIGGRAACASDRSVCGGVCDGANRGACTYPNNTTACRVATCTNGVGTLAATCNGAGQCSAAVTQACGAYVCGSAACETSCTTDGDCIDAAWCDASANPGQCRQDLPPGGACVRDHQCLSGHCVDGNCCDSPCTNQCAACNLPGTAGQCLPVPQGAPLGGRSLCAGQADPNSGAASLCGGSCDGASVSCVFPTAATACRPASCLNGIASTATACNGLGDCAAPVTTACAPFACDPAGLACLTSCATDSDCTSGDHCSGGTCVAGCLTVQATCLDATQCCQTLTTHCDAVSSLSDDRCCRPPTVFCAEAADCCGDAICGTTAVGPTYCCFPDGHACVPSQSAPTGCCLGGVCLNNACCTPQDKSVACAGRCGFITESACGLSYDCGTCGGEAICTTDQHCCTPHSYATTCNAVCGDIVDNCGQTIACTCGSLKNCVAGRCVDCAPLGGNCGYPAYDSGCCQTEATMCRTNTVSSNKTICCHGLHGSCTGDYQCCESLQCSGGGCCFPTNYQDCGADSDCCSGSCSGGSCD